MTSIKQRPSFIKITESCFKEFNKKKQELIADGYTLVGPQRKIEGSYVQGFVRYDVDTLSKFTYVTDYLFEAELSGKFDIDIINRLYDRWSEEDKLLPAAKPKKAWFKEI